MYGWLTYNYPPILGVNFPDWDFERTPEITGKNWQRRVDQAGTRVKEAFATDPELKLAAFSAIASALREVAKEDHVDYAVRMGVAFYLKHRDDHVAVQAAIARAVDAELGPMSPTSHPTLAGMSQRLKKVCFLMAEAIRPSFINEFASFARNAVADDAGCQELAPIRGYVVALTKLLALVQPELQSSVMTIAGLALLSATPDAVKKVGETLVALVTARRFDVFQELAVLVASAQASKDPPRAFLHRAIHLCLSKAIEQPERPVRKMVELVFAGMRALGRSRERVLAHTTIAAIDKGLDLGSLTESSKDALDRWRQQCARFEEQRLHLVLADARARATGGLAPDAMSRELLQCLSINQLVEWINGPTFGEHSLKIDEKDGIRAVQTDQIEQHQLQAQQKPQVRPTAKFVAPALTEAEIGLISSNGYRATADFLLSDLKDQLSLAERLATDPGLIAAAKLQSQPLETLSHTQGRVDWIMARDLLTEADTAITALRRGVRRAKAAKAAQDKEDGFILALRDALLSETLALGNRRGGVIAYPLTLNDYDWVVDRCHRCWCSGIDRLQSGNVEIELGDNQALAFYVTGSSLSGYDFDVSVHLWRRYQGTTGPMHLGADEPEKLFPPMDTTQAFDTFQTCAVLHVPHRG